MDEYRVKVTVKNNLLLSAIEAAGYSSIAEFERAADIRYGGVAQFVALRTPPITQDGEFTAIAKTIMEVLGAAPADLWTDQQLYIRLKRNSASRNVSELMAQHLLENHITAMTLPSPVDSAERGETTNIVAAALNTLTPIEEEVLRLHHGIGDSDEHTLDEIAKKIHRSRERVRQIEAKALRKLRHPTRVAVFEQCLEN